MQLSGHLLENHFSGNRVNQESSWRAGGNHGLSNYSQPNLDRGPEQSEGLHPRMSVTPGGPVTLTN